MDKKKLEIFLEMLSNLSNTFPVTEEYIEKMLLDICSKGSG